MERLFKLEKYSLTNFGIETSYYITFYKIDDPTFLAGGDFYKKNGRKMFSVVLLEETADGWIIGSSVFGSRIEKHYINRREWRLVEVEE